MASKNLRKVLRTQKLGQDRLITLLGKQCTEINDKDKFIERIQKFYVELNDSEQSAIIHINPKEVPEIILWEVEAALRDMKNGQQYATTIYIHRDIASRRRYHLEDTC